MINFTLPVFNYQNSDIFNFIKQNFNNIFKNEKYSVYGSINNL